MSDPRYIFNLRDTTFAHDISTVAGVQSTRVQWNRDSILKGRPTFFSHEQMFSPLVNNVPPTERFGLLIESQSIIPDIYRKVPEVFEKFHAVFTHSEYLINTYPNARWIPGGGTWIGGRFAGGEPQIYSKGSGISIVTSHKLKASLHKKRYALAWWLKLFSSSVDVFMPPKFGMSYMPIGESLRDYRYSIVIENFVGSGYFTEKILNCFAMGTVPIYIGAPDIASYFDVDGIIQAHSISEIARRIIPRLTEDDYRSRSAAIQNNFHEGIKYKTIEDFIVQHYGSLFVLR